MGPREEAAVQAAVKAVEAHRRRNGGHRPHASHSAADVLERRLDGLDWESFRGRGYRLLREVARRRGFGQPDSTGGKPDDHGEIGAKFEEATESARRRLSRAGA